MDSNKDITVSSSWTLESQSNNDLKSCISVNTSRKSVDLEDVVKLETCVNLVQKHQTKSQDPCTVKITINLSESTAHPLIDQVVIVSEARLIELFGTCDEYLTTNVAEYIDDFEGCAVYMATCVVKPVKELLIKFQKTKQPDSLWIYGINLRLCLASPSPLTSSINFQSVNEILKEARIPLSENAEKCKAFLQTYGGALNSQFLPKTKAPSSQMLIKMLEAGYIHPLGETGKSMSKCLSNFVPFLARDSLYEKKTEDSCKGGDQSSSEPQSDVLVLKSYVDQRFIDLENKLAKFEQNMKDMEMRQNEKLDHIIALLSKSNV